MSFPPLTLGGAIFRSIGQTKLAREKAQGQRDAAASKREFQQRMTLMDARAELLKQGIDPDAVDPGAAASAVASQAEGRLASDGKLNSESAAMLSSIMAATTGALNAADAAGVDNALRALAAFAGIPLPPEMDGVSGIQTAAAANAADIDVSEQQGKPPDFWTIAAVVGVTLAIALGLAAVVRQ